MTSNAPTTGTVSVPTPRFSRRAALRIVAAGFAGSATVALLAACGDATAPTATAGAVAPASGTGGAPTVAPRAATAPATAGGAVNNAMAAGAKTNYKTWSLSEYQQQTGKMLAQFNEAPSLAMKVAAKQLPPVKERLPDEPLVVQPIEKLGKYCDKITGYGVNPTSFGNDVYTARQQHFIAIYPDQQTFVPQVAQTFTLSDDKKTFVVKLRKGMKWSDGTPFTADDVMFWYEDFLTNKDLNAAITSDLTPGGKVVQATKTSDDTITFAATVPYPTIIEIMAITTTFLPKNYLKKWHSKYNPDADKVAKDEGFQTWVQAFQAHSAAQGPDFQDDAKLPTLDPWMLARTDQFGNKYFDRNPYYWKVDTAGNQLPYAESEVRLLTGNLETTILKIKNGEIDFGSQQLQLKDYPVLKQGETAGNYRALLWQGVTGADHRFQVNLTVKDPVLNKIFNDVRFRQALSLAINRDEINEAIFFGRGTPRQFTAPPSSSYYEESYGKSYAEYDPARANKLLDDMGLKRGGTDQPRMRPDGKPLQFTVEDATFNEKMDELVRDYWAKIGVQVTIKSETRELYSQRANANELEASVWFGDSMDEFTAHVRPFSFRPPWGIDNVPHSGSPWNTWRLTNGKDGQEPPQDVKDLIDLTDRFRQTTRGTDEYTKLGKEMLSRNVAGLYSIGTVGLVPSVIIARKNLRNFPENQVAINYLIPIHGDQWFLE